MSPAGLLVRNMSRAGLLGWNNSWMELVLELVLELVAQLGREGPSLPSLQL